MKNIKSFDSFDPQLELFSFFKKEKKSIGKEVKFEFDDMYIWFYLNFKDGYDLDAHTDSHMIDNDAFSTLDDDVDEGYIFKNLNLFDFSERINKYTKEANTITHLDCRKVDEYLGKEFLESVGKFIDSKIRSNTDKVHKIFDKLIAIIDFNGGDVNVRSTPFGYVLQFDDIDNEAYNKFIKYIESL